MLEDLQKVKPETSATKTENSRVIPNDYDSTDDQSVREEQVDLDIDFMHVEAEDSGSMYRNFQISEIQAGYARKLIHHLIQS